MSRQSCIVMLDCSQSGDYGKQVLAAMHVDDKLANSIDNGC